MPRSPLPDYRDPCGWNALLPPRQAKAARRGDGSPRAMRRRRGLHRPSRRRGGSRSCKDAAVVVLEGSTVGEGSSARATPASPIRGIQRSGCRSTSWSGPRRSTSSRRRLRFSHGGDGEGRLRLRLERTGPHHRRAATELGAQKIRSMVEGAVAHGFAHEALDGPASRRIIGTDYYRAGIARRRGTCCSRRRWWGVWADTLPRACVCTREFTGAIAGARGPAGGSARLTRRFEAKKVVLANQRRREAFRLLAGRSRHDLHLRAITEAMKLQEAGSSVRLLGGLLPAHRLGTTVRRVGENRHMVRSLLPTRNLSIQPKSAGARELLSIRRYPGLAHVKLEHVWGGTTALTMNGAPRGAGSTTGSTPPPDATALVSSRAPCSASGWRR